MNQVIIVGCDLHDRNMVLRFAAGKGEPLERSFHNDEQGRLKMIDHLKQFASRHGAGRIVFVYEASGQGYGLYDLLIEQGIECHVLSPAHLPKTPKSKRRKTDPLDAQMLLEQARGFLLAGNKLPVVWIPPQRLRDDRELVRARLEAGEATTRVKLQIFSLLKRYTVALPEWFHRNRSWTKRFVRWLRDLAETMSEVVRPVLLGLIDRFEGLRDEVTALERHLRHLAKTSRYKSPYEALRKISGVGLVTSLVYLTEMGDLNRFDNRRQIAAYLGLCPSSHESGEASDRKGHITRQGPGRIRKVLCQAAWAAIRTDPETRATWTRLQKGKTGQGKKAVVAVMRKLAIRMWHVAMAAGVSVELMQNTPPPSPGRTEASSPGHLAHAG